MWSLIFSKYSIGMKKSFFFFGDLQQQQQHNSNNNTATRQHQRTNIYNIFFLVHVLNFCSDFDTPFFEVDKSLNIPFSDVHSLFSLSLNARNSTKCLGNSRIPVITPAFHEIPYYCNTVR